FHRPDRPIRSRRSHDRSRPVIHRSNTRMNNQHDESFQDAASPAVDAGTVRPRPEPDGGAAAPLEPSGGAGEGDRAPGAGAESAGEEPFGGPRGRCGRRRNRRGWNRRRKGAGENGAAAAFEEGAERAPRTTNGGRGEVAPGDADRV